MNHKQVLDLLEERIEGSRRYMTWREVVFSGEKDGEIDYYIMLFGKRQYLSVFEVKGKDTEKGYIKAVQQLERAAEYCAKKHHFPLDRIVKFYVYGRKKTIGFRRVT